MLKTKECIWNHDVLLFHCILLHVASTDEELKSVKQKLEQKQKEIDDLRSLLKTKEGTWNHDVLLFHCILLHIATDEELKSVKQKLEQKQKEIHNLLKTKEGKYFATLKYGILMHAIKRQWHITTYIDPQNV